MTQTRLTPSPIVPMVADGEIDIKAAQAIVLRNAGTATVELWNGMYTLDSKETLSLNATEENAFIDLLNIPVRFNTGTGSSKILQIVVLKASNC